jgi:hypothetical protein
VFDKQALIQQVLIEPIQKWFSLLFSLDLKVVMECMGTDLQALLMHVILKLKGNKICQKRKKRCIADRVYSLCIQTDKDKKKKNTINITDRGRSRHRFCQDKKEKHDKHHQHKDEKIQKSREHFMYRDKAVRATVFLLDLMTRKVHITK